MDSGVSYSYVQSTQYRCANFVQFKFFLRIRLCNTIWLGKKIYFLLVSSYVGIFNFYYLCTENYYTTYTYLFLQILYRLPVQSSVFILNHTTNHHGPNIDWGGNYCVHSTEYAGGLFIFMDWLQCHSRLQIKSMITFLSTNYNRGASVNHWSTVHLHYIIIQH